MKILLEELPHQLEALQALDEAFYGLDERTKDPDKDYVYANPIVKGRGNENTNIDIKMETGTGKTYVACVPCMSCIKNTAYSNLLSWCQVRRLKKVGKTLLLRIMPSSTFRNIMKIHKSTST
ncbi:hypothetical protein I131_07910 [Enterococcus faecium CRL1879]|nr:hypothetical protein I131_07910 [Enterococcus faecium CRL1879]